MFHQIRNLNFISRRFFQSASNTIFALSTNIKSSGSAIAVIRVSGPKTHGVLDKLTKGNSPKFLSNPRKAILQSVYDKNELIDRAMMLWFPGPNSYTGEDMCEFHLHGSQAVIAKMYRVLFLVDGCRPAKEGEFTKRALINGKVGLIEAEAIGDLIKSKTDLQRKRALSAFSGSIDEKLESWRSELIKNMAHLEAYIDFGEDELIEDNVMRDFSKNIAKLSYEIENYLANSSRRSDLIKDGVQVAIVGEANVGKSSLMNRLCQKNLSIVSPISGTTRDVVQGHLDFAGYSLSISDTAGIKELQSSIDIIEQEGIKRALQHAQHSHVLILVIDATRSNSLDLSDHVSKAIHNKTPEEMIFVVNKIDLIDDDQAIKLKNNLQTEFSKSKQEFCFISCNSGEGLDKLTEMLEKKVEKLCGDPESEICYSNDRHVMHLTKTMQLLKSIQTDGDLAIAASNLRQAAHQLSCLTGNITTDDVLDVIFRDFCIGK